MNDARGIETEKRSLDGRASNVAADRHLHSAWLQFIRYCTELEYGEIEKLKIQNGLPMIAELAVKKVKFTS